MRNIPFGQEGDFSEQSLKDRYNNELANKLGNLVSRVSGMVNKKEGKITKVPVDKELSDKLNMILINEYMESFQLDKGLNEIFNFVEECNEYVQKKQPWTLEGKERNKVLYTLADSIRVLSILLSPFIPSACDQINSQYGFPKPTIKNVKFGLTKSGKIKKGEILFKKID